MDDLITFSITVFTGFFAIMNPIANVPIFLSLVKDADTGTQKRIAQKSTSVAFIIIVAFVVFGKFIFMLFGITIPAFKVTGGILIFYVAFDMLQSKKSAVKHLSNPHIDENLAVSPLAIPILAGPGTIVTAMNFVTNSGFIHICVVITIFAALCLLTYYFFLMSDRIVEILGNNIISVIGKVMGLIIAIIGINMIIEGIKIAFGLNV